MSVIKKSNIHIALKLMLKHRHYEDGPFGQKTFKNLKASPYLCKTRVAIMGTLRQRHKTKAKVLLMPFKLQVEIGIEKQQIY